jgi:hypothetical protein
MGEEAISRLAQSVQCLTTDRTAGVRSPTEAEDFSSNPCVQTGSGAHPASCTMGTGGSLSGGKARPGRDADHSPTSSAKVKSRSYTSSPQAPPRICMVYLYLENEKNKIKSLYQFTNVVTNFFTRATRSIFVYEAVTIPQNQ